MKNGVSSLGFEHFEWHRPGVSFPGKAYSNDWFMGRLRGNKIGSSGDIEARTGILSRDIADCTETVLSMACASVQSFFERHIQFKRKQCAQILLLTSAVDRSVLGTKMQSKKPAVLVQATAERLAHEVGMGGNHALGVCYACSSAAKGAERVLEHQDQLQDDQFALLVASEKLSGMNDLSSPSTGFLFGDGVGIAVMKHSARFRMLHVFAQEHPSTLIRMRDIDDALTIRDERGLMNCIEMDGKEVFRQATDLMMRALAKSLYETERHPQDIGILVPHQANARFVDQLEREWKQRYSHLRCPPIDISISHAGNTGAGGWIRRMAEKQQDGSLNDVQGLIAAPFAGGGQYMRSDALSYGNILLGRRS